ncbi:MAG: HesA/MoeB/ThiF family protein [Nanoarchaeota archaeon]|nr:HesA/MoeB/ThiF family protein [Nanoarchaeota archaeon]
MESRYSRQETYIGKSNQRILSGSTVAIVGIGAIGTGTASLLARAGVGNIILIDRDVIELNNLQRQTLFNESDIGKPKASQAKKHLEKINSGIKITAFNDDLNNENISNYIPKNIKLILDCTDNMETRFLINDYALKNNIPWVYSAGIQSKLALMNIIPKKTPCFSCIFATPASLETCQTVGVLNSTTSMVSSLQVSEAIKILLNDNPSRYFIRINLEENNFEKLRIKKRKGCPACNDEYIYLNSINPQGILKFCSTGNYQIKIKVNLDKLKKDLSKIGKLEDFGSCIKFKNMLIFSNRCLIKAESEKQAKVLVSKYIGN